MDQVGDILKEGYLGVQREKGSLLKSKYKSRYWTLSWKSEKKPVLECFKDKTKTTLKERILSSQVENVQVVKQKHGDFICISYGKRVVHLRAANKEQRDEWYSALCDWLGQTVDDQEGKFRRRVFTDSTDSRPRASPNKGKRVDSSPVPYEATYLQDELKAILQTRKDDAAIPPIQEESTHESAVSAVGIGNFYENVPVGNRSLRGPASTTADPIYEIHLPREPIEHDERAVLGMPGSVSDEFNNLDRVSSQHEAGQDCNLNVRDRESDGHSRTNSLESNEDNNEPEPEVKLRPAGEIPTVPFCVGEAHQKKIRRLREEQRQPHGISKTLSKMSLIFGDQQRILLMENKDGIWVIWVDPKHIRGSLRVGDQIIKVNSQILPSASFALETIRSTDSDEVSIVVKRIPHATIVMIERPSEYDDLGIRLEGNEIIQVDPEGLASTRGNLKPQTTGVSGCMCNWAITEVNTKPVDLFASSEDVMKMLRLALKDVSLVLQPVDFIQLMRDRLKWDDSSPSQKESQ